jgi:AraC-like DNA-binding protein
MGAHLLTPVNLSDSSRLDSLVEHRRVFNLPHCELNIFETFCKCDNVILSYSGGLVVSSMMRGKKVMSVEGINTFDFLPGETVILPEGVTMKVDFPDADERHPVQCATLALDWDMVNKNLVFLNEHYPNKQAPFEWMLDFSHYHFDNNIELASSINKLVNLSMEDNPAKEAMADLSLKLFLLRLIQTQHLLSVNTKQRDDGKIQPAIDYVHKHLTEKISVAKMAQQSCMSQSAFYQYFKNTLGITPLEYVLRARIDYAKKLMADTSITVAEVAYASGFNNLNYFIKVFKHLEGITPSKYRHN